MYTIVRTSMCDTVDYSILHFPFLNCEPTGRELENIHWLLISSHFISFVGWKSRLVFFLSFFDIQIFQTTSSFHFAVCAST